MLLLATQAEEREAVRQAQAHEVARQSQVHAQSVLDQTTQSGMIAHLLQSASYGENLPSPSVPLSPPLSDTPSHTCVSLMLFSMVLLFLLVFLSSPPRALAVCVGVCVV